MEDNERAAIESLIESVKLEAVSTGRSREYASFCEVVNAVLPDDMKIPVLYQFSGRAHITIDGIGMATYTESVMAENQTRANELVKEMIESKGDVWMMRYVQDYADTYGVAHKIFQTWAADIDAHTFDVKLGAL